MSEEVPDIAIDEWRHVSPLSMVAQMLLAMGKGVIPAMLVLYGAGTGNADKFARIAPYMGLAVFGIVFVSLLASWLRWIRLRYRVGEHDVRVEQGLVSRRARAVPYERIQDVSLEQKLVPRLLGLVEVKFETGAGGKEELKLSFVSAAEGEKLRETVRALVDGEHAALVTGGEQPAAEAPEQGRLLFAMSPRRLLLFGLFNFSLVAFAAIAGAAQQFDFLLPFDWWDWRMWQEQLAGPGSWLAGLHGIAAVVGVVLALGAFVVVGFTTGLTRTVLRDWNFRLERTAKGFRRRRGLFTLTDVVMPVHRVQALVVKTGVLRRLWGWHGLSFISLAQDAGKANHDVAPFAQMAEIAPIAEEAGFHLPQAGQHWHRPSPNYHFDRALVMALVLAIPAIGNVLFGEVWVGLLISVAAVVLVLREAMLWRHARHALDAQQVLARHGWLAPKLELASRVKLHSVEISQHRLGRWRGYCTLHFGLAGGRLAFAGMAEADARQMRAAVLESISAVDFARLAR